MNFLLPPEDAQALTEPSHSAMWDAHEYALSKWNEVSSAYPDFAKPQRPAERYAVMHRLVADYLASHLAENAVYTERLSFSALLLDNRALVRFKHLNSDLSHRVYPTDQQKHLGRQEFTGEMVKQLAFDGVTAPPTVLTLGYTETPAGDAISRVAVVCRTPKLYYAYDVLPGATGAGGLPIVVTPLPGNEPPGPRVISTREEKKRRDDAGD